MSILASSAQTIGMNRGNDKALAISLVVIFAAFVIATLVMFWRDAKEHDANDEREEYDQ